MYIIRIQFVVLDPYVSLNVWHFKLVKACQEARVWPKPKPAWAQGKFDEPA